jgi:hypothetical protein
MAIIMPHDVHGSGGRGFCGNWASVPCWKMLGMEHSLHALRPCMDPTARR